jgi:hypothetical protein
VRRIRTLAADAAPGGIIAAPTAMIAVATVSAPLVKAARRPPSMTRAAPTAICVKMIQRSPFWGIAFGIVPSVQRCVVEDRPRGAPVTISLAQPRWQPGVAGKGDLVLISVSSPPQGEALRR